MNIVQVNKHDDLRVIKSEIGEWFYTKEDIEPGRYDIEVINVHGRWWVTKATPEKPVDHKQLMKEFRERVSNARRLPN